MTETGFRVAWREWDDAATHAVRGENRSPRAPPRGTEAALGVKTAVHSKMEGMDSIHDQIRELQASVRRQRIAIFTLVGLLTGIALIGAARPVGDATFDTITCKKWKVVDNDGKVRIEAVTNDGAALLVLSDTGGKPRICANTNADGTAGMVWLDKNKKARIATAITSDGEAGTTWIDVDGNQRITAGTGNKGVASLKLRDTIGTLRIAASTNADSDAGMLLFDKHGKARLAATAGASGSAGAQLLNSEGRPRIQASMDADGTVVFPTNDGK